MIIFLIFVHYGLVFDFKSKATILPSVRNLSFYVYLFFSIGFNLVLDYTLKLRNFLFDKHLSTELFRQKTMKSKEKKKQLKYKRSERNFNNNEISGMNLMNKNSILQGYHFNDHERISYFNKNNLGKITVIKRCNSKGVPEKIFKFKKEKKSNEEKESNNL